MRAWLKLYLRRDDKESLEIVSIVKVWKASRLATLHTTRAIRLYDALLRGDTSVLEECFPGIALAFGMRPRQPQRSPITPPNITVVPRSESDDLADALDIGIGDLDL